MVRFENVGLRYGVGQEVLRDCTFRIEPGSFQFLTGPSGAGKTSLLRLLFMALKPTRGLVTLFGHDVALLTKDAHGLYARYGFKPLADPAMYMEIVDPDVYLRGRPAGPN